MADIANSTLFSAGIPQIEDACIVLVKTEWNADIVDELELGCRAILSSIPSISTTTITVPGAFEIPFAIKNHWSKNQDNPTVKKPDAFIAFGTIIQGDTPHFDYVCKAITDGVVQLNLLLPIPVIFGVLTVNNHQQAIERVGGLHGHKGKEAAITALKMIALAKSL